MAKVPRKTSLMFRHIGAPFVFHWPGKTGLIFSRGSTRFSPRPERSAAGGAGARRAQGAGDGAAPAEGAETAPLFFLSPVFLFSCAPLNAPVGYIHIFFHQIGVFRFSQMVCVFGLLLFVFFVVIKRRPKGLFTQPEKVCCVF